MATRDYRRERLNLLPQRKPPRIEPSTPTICDISRPIKKLEEGLPSRQVNEQCNDLEKLKDDVIKLLKDIEERNKTIQSMRNTLDLIEFQRDMARPTSPQKQIGFYVTRTSLGNVRDE